MGNLLNPALSGSVKDNTKIKGYSAQEDALKVTSMQKKLRDDFLLVGGLDTAKWDLVVGSGMNVVASNGFVLTTGVNTNVESYILSKEVFTIPMRVSVGLTLSQRIVNQGFYIELISVDPVTLVPDNKNIAAWKFDGTSAVSNQYRVTNSGAAVQDSAYLTTTTTAGGGLFEIEAFTDEAWFHSNIVDNAVARAASFRKHLRIPDPNALYKLRIRAINGGTAPTSTTTMTISYASIEDYAEVMAEITAGRGQGSSGQAMGVQVLNQPAVSINWPTPSNSGGGFSNVGKMKSAATTNATSVKGSAAVLGSLEAENRSATVRYLKIYNKATAPTVGTDTPVWTIMLPANSIRSVPIPAFGMRLSAGFALAITAGIYDNDVAAVGADEVSLNWSYN